MKVEVDMLGKDVTVLSCDSDHFFYLVGFLCKSIYGQKYIYTDIYLLPLN